MGITIDIIRLSIGFFLQVFPCAYLCIMPFDSFTISRRVKILTYGLIILMTLAFAVSGTYIKHSFNNPDTVFTLTNAVFMLLFACCAAFYFITVKAPLPQKILVICFVAIYAFFVSLISTVIWNYFTNIVYGSDFIEDNPYSLRYDVVLLIFTIFSFMYARRLIKKYIIPLLEVLDIHDLMYMSAISAILLVLLSLCFTFMRNEFIKGPISLFISLTLCIAIAGIYIVIFLFVKRMKETQELRMRLLKSEHTSDMAQEQYSHILEMIESQRVMRHNFSQQLITLRGLCDTHDENIHKYLCEYLDQIPQYTVLSICPNTVLNSIISYYKYTAETDGFDFECNIDLPLDMRISDADLVTILGNLLENAIHAGRKLQKNERRIILNIGFSNKMLGIAVDNSFNGDVIIKDGAYVSTKHSRPALGIKSIKDIAEKYGGTAVFTHRGNTFYSSVMLANL